MTRPRIALIGDFYRDEQEAYVNQPFVGASGQELDRMLADAGVSRTECFVRNIFPYRAAFGKIEPFCGAKSNPLVAQGLPPLAAGKYLLAEHASHVDVLRRQLADLQPHVTVLLGNTASWAVMGVPSVAKTRGTCALSPYVPELKCLSTYHPGTVLSQYDLRHVTVFDMVKAKRESEFPELRRPNREIWLAPTLADIREFYERFIRGIKGPLSVDIETAGEQITCIGFAPTIDRAICIPFVDPRKGSGSYWDNLGDELAAWALVREILSDPIPKLGQNFLYDISYIWQRYGLPIVNFDHDTMLLHHSLQPELPKGLDFLGSVYCNEVSWKSDRPRGEQTIKRED